MLQEIGNIHKDNKKMKKKYLGILTKRFLEKEYTKNKKSTKAIAKMLDCHKDTVLNKLNKFKIFLRLGCKDKKLTLKHKKKLSKAHKGIITWNTGLTKKTDKRLLKFSKKFKGRTITWGDKISKAKKGKKLEEEHKRKIKEALAKIRKKNPKFNVTKIVKHHIYLKENSEKTIRMTRGKHRKLHARAYDFIYYTLGEKGIDNYIKWFKRRY